MNINACCMGAFGMMSSKLKGKTNTPVSCADHPTPHVGTRQKKRKAAAPSGGAQGAEHGLAGLADMASRFTAGQKRPVPFIADLPPWQSKALHCACFIVCVRVCLKLLSMAIGVRKGAQHTAPSPALA